ncbi:MAG: hypothetical protein H6733_10625 [Alphaproteobacteria bacterium]|nr:hypothetical protein [Alphaproteobacteria bacterium]
MWTRRPAAWGVCLAIGAASCGGDNYDPRRYGEECFAFDECASGLVCASDGICRSEGEPGTVRSGGDCVATAQCRLDLVCAHEGVCAPAGDPGTAAFGESCAAPTDCQAELDCFDGVCKGVQMPIWAGEPCPDPETEDGPYRVFWEIPGDEGLEDFYRFPYPNDGRVDGDTIDVTDHPGPGPLLPIVGDVVGNVIRSVSTDLGGGFGANQAVFLRFSAFPDSSTLTFGLPGEGTIGLVDITPGMSQSTIEAFRFELTSRRTPYICHNWLAVHPLDGRPLQAGHTYAVILTRSVLDDSGATLTQDADFAMALGDARPTEVPRAKVWDAYAPLRAWLSEQSVDPASIGAAVVYTVGDTLDRPRKLRDAVLSAPLPALSPLFSCEDSDQLAVPGDDSRGCTGAHTDFVELQGTVGLPQFQEGTPPFKDATDGGAIDVTGAMPSVERVEDVQVAFTVPTGAEMPANGWPVILYGHGTGGSYTSVIRSGFADAHTVIDVDGVTVRFAMVGFDAPMHGPRAHSENWKQAWLDVDPGAYDSDVLFFNPLNVRATRDNALQEAADLWSMVRVLQDLDLDETASPTGSALRFDLDHVYYVGHSQGAVTAPVFLAFEPGVRGALLSGAGGLTIAALLDKTSPHDVKAAVRVGLADPDVTRVHPILNLAQQLAEASDGVNFARHLFRTPLEGVDAKHVFQTFGLGDTYSPDSTQYALARAMGVDQIPNGNPALDRIDEVALGVSGNAPGGVTGVTVLYSAVDRDAHYVLFDRTDAAAHADSFLGTAVTDGTPTLGVLP